MKMNNKLIITFIGSRNLSNPENTNDANLFYKTAYRCAELGIIMRSGLANGADGIAQIAYSDAIKSNKARLEQLEVYIKDEQERSKSNLPNKHLAIIRNPNLIIETENLASTVHPNWNACNDYARGMHSRNCHQIFGYNLDIPTDAVICWTPNGNVVGGTSTAIKLALNSNIPVFNLGFENKSDVLNNIKNFLIYKKIKCKQ